MFHYIKFYSELCFLKVAPQDAPASTNAYYISVFSYFIVGAIVISLNQTMLTGLFLSGVQTGLLMFLANLVLWIKKTPERYHQTMTALCATGAIIGLIALPIMSFLSTTGTTGVEADSLSFGFLVWLVLILWESWVIAHILKHSMDIPMIAGLAGSFVYMYLSFAITLRVLKVMSISIG
ncbi:MAG: hypothetical protein OEX07_10825 [Gammaproteobacteria bacterium]|nr:hypothetical protein [Gammaproteobacteria bacterium]